MGCVENECEAQIRAKGLCQKHYNRARYLANKDAHSTRCKNWRESNVERKREIDKNYYDANKERILSSRSEYYKANKDSLKEYGKDYYRANSERYKARSLAWRRNNRESVCATNARRRLKTKASMSSQERKDSVSWRFLIKDRPCACCQEFSDHMEFDHILPVHKGGDDRWFNIVNSCRACNRSKHTTELFEFSVKTVKYEELPGT